MGLLVVLLASLLAVGADERLDRQPASIREREESLARRILAPLRDAGLWVDGREDRDAKAACNVSRYAHAIRTERFTETWPDERGAGKTIAVKAEVWTDAFQAALNENARVFVPSRRKPYYIDRPLIMRSGGRLDLAPDAEIRLRPGSNCCMLRNAHLVSGQTGPVTLSDDADHDIVITGGIWTTLATGRWRQSNGNVRGRADPKGSFHAHGVIVLNNVRRLRVSGVTIRQCRPHGVQLSNCSQFCVAGIRFEDHRRDGVHINGPASYGVVRNVRVGRGVMGDDMVALNAWDWKHTSMTFGPIHHVLVEDVDGRAVGETRGGQADGAQGHDSEIRLLAGTKHFGDGHTLNCSIEDCVIRRVAGIRTFKMYDQPNLELGRDKDFADPIGEMRNLLFSDIRIDRATGAAFFQIHANVNGIAIRDVVLGFDPAPRSGKPFALVQVGPISQTYKFDQNDPSRWVEIFSPDKDCVVRGLDLSNVRALGKRVNADDLVRVIEQTLNKDYPRTTPRGGRGKGVLRSSPSRRPIGPGPDGPRRGVGPL